MRGERREERGERTEERGQRREERGKRKEERGERREERGERREGGWEMEYSLVSKASESKTPPSRLVIRLLDKALTM